MPTPPKQQLAGSLRRLGIAALFLTALIVAPPLGGARADEEATDQPAAEEPAPAMQEQAPAEQEQAPPAQEAEPAAQEQAPAEAEAPAAEEPAKGETPTAEEAGKGETPAAEEPGKGETPVTEEPGKGETPVAEEPGKGETPVAEEPGKGETPVTEEPGKGETPVAEEPGKGETPVAGEPGKGETPVTEEPGKGETPVAGEPGKGETPVTEEPGKGETPVAGEPGKGKTPVAGEPGKGNPETAKTPTTDTTADQIPPTDVGFQTPTPDNLPPDEEQLGAPPEKDFADLVPKDELDAREPGEDQLVTTVIGGVPPAQMCPADVHQCKDGSTVSRNPAQNCEFAECPDAQCGAKSVFACADGTSAPKQPGGCEDAALCRKPPEDACANGACQPENLVPREKICLPCLQAPPTPIEINVFIEQTINVTVISDFTLERDIRIGETCLQDQSCVAKCNCGAKIVEKIKSCRREKALRLLKTKQARQVTLVSTQKKRVPVKVDTDCGCGAGKSVSTVVWSNGTSDKAIVAHLVAAPVKAVAKCYSRQELLTQTSSIVSQGFARADLPSVAVDTIRFGFNQAVVRPEEMVNLDRIGHWMEIILADHPNEVFVIEGHTDGVGADDFNLKLSKARAEAVKQALVAYYNIPQTALTTVGLGKRFPIVQTDKPEIRNRRIVLRRVTPLLCSASTQVGKQKVVTSPKPVTSGEASMCTALSSAASVQGDAVKSSMTGNTIAGNFGKSGPYTEFYAADGTIKTKGGAVGKWQVKGDRACFTYGKAEEYCLAIKMSEDHLCWFYADGKVAGSGVVQKGNANGY